MNKKRLGEHLEKLATFKAVADLKSVHRASFRLGLSQPAVSRTIKVLEEILESRLMERKAKGIQLTLDGERLYGYAKLLAQTLEDFDATGEVKSDASRLFRIATYDNIACGILSGFGSILATEFPHLSISVGGPNSRILGDLIGGKFDCALIAEPRILPGLEYKKLFSERYGFFISRDVFRKSRLNRKSNLRLGDLRNFRLIAMPDAIAGANKSIDRLLWEIGLAGVLAIDSYEVAIRLVLDGHGIGIMPYSSTWSKIQDGNLVELLVREISSSSFGPHDLTLCWNANNPHPKRNTFERILAERYSQI